MDRILPRLVDTVIVGAGPSALILSYILHGHIPVYDRANPHPDPLLHRKLKDTEDLLNINVDSVTDHFEASRFSYSTQALPVNVLLDTLLRPVGETDDVANQTCVRWQYDPTRAVPHLVIGDTSQTGGQWVNDPIKTSRDIGTLSYAGMLSLPGYGFSDFYFDRYNKSLPSYFRPSRREVSDYFAAYPKKVNIAKSIRHGETVAGIHRVGSGFYIASHKLFCNHLVLASGVFTKPVAPTQPLRSLLSLPRPDKARGPVLVIGSGFSAADVILSTDPSRKILHVYKWSPTNHPSPLKACHQQAYPEYAGIYRKMKLAAISSVKSKNVRPKLRRNQSSALDNVRDWDSTYEGLPNATVLDAYLNADDAIVTFQIGSEPPFQRKIGSLAYVVGRRGSLAYLENDLQHEICPMYRPTEGVSGRDMREQANEDLEVAENVFIIGSLTGDTLIRFTYGGCTYAAGRIMEDMRLRNSPKQEPQCPCCCKRVQQHRSPTSRSNSPSFIPTMNGLDGHNTSTHRDVLPLDRRKVMA